MTLLNYIHNISQTHLAGHLSPKSSRPATPMASEPVTPIDAVPPTLPATAPTPSESLPDAFVDAPTDPVEPTEIATAVIAESEPYPAPATETIEGEQPVAAEPIALGAPVETKAEEHAETAAPIVQPEVADATEVKPLVDDAHKQPTTTHAETGTLHTATEPATTVDGIPADKPAEETPAVAFAEPKAEAKEGKKEEKKAASKEKVEKTKAEGKGFFAKFFGSKDKSPKKEKKVKTPKSEQADPTPVTDASATAEETAEASSSVPATEVRTIEATESKPEITGVGLAAEPVAQVPAHVPEEAPVASTSAVIAEPEAVKETETTAPATAEPAVETKTETKPEMTAAEKEVKAQKAHRRISTRITSFVKNIGGKKEPHGKEEHGKEAETPAEPTSAPVVSDEAPKIAEPTPAEPIQIDEKKPSTTTHAGPPAAPVVATAA